MSDTMKLVGKLVEGDPGRDAIHVAVVPVVAGEKLQPGTNVALGANNEAWEADVSAIGIVDPFLKYRVQKGQRFFLFLYPGSITSLAHVWTHPSFPEPDAVLGASTKQETTPEKSASEKWMRRWAVRHVGRDYYGDEKEFPEDVAYEFAIRIGHEHNVGPYEDARDHIDNEWWAHWELITGCKGDRDQYFSCAC